MEFFNIDLSPDLLAVSWWERLDSPACMQHKADERKRKKREKQNQPTGGGNPPKGASWQK